MQSEDHIKTRLGEKKNPGPGIEWETVNVKKPLYLYG